MRQNLIGRVGQQGRFGIYPDEIELSARYIGGRATREALASDSRENDNRQIKTPAATRRGKGENDRTHRRKRHAAGRVQQGSQVWPKARFEAHGRKAGFFTAE
jgi:hypothetical protein